MKILMIISLFVGFVFGNSTSEYDIAINKEKKIMPLFKDIDILRGKVLILEKREILDTMNLIFEEELVNQIISNPNIIRKKP